MFRNLVQYLQYRVGLAEPITQTTWAERKVLRELAHGRRRLVEIGVYHGVNTQMFREVMAEDGVLIAVDPFERFLFGLRGYGWARRIAHREVRKVNRGQVLWVEDTGANSVLRPEVRKLLPVDFIFIDGDHSYEGLRADWTSWSSQVEPDGVVALHDSRQTPGSGSQRFTSSVILHDIRFEVVALVDSLTVLKRHS